MSCNLPEEFLPLHAGGDLSVAEASQVEAHLTSCEPCREELRAYKSAREALLEIRVASQPSESLWGELDARLDAVEAAGRHRLPWFQRMGFAPVLMTAAALLLAVVFYPDRGNSEGLNFGQPKTSESVQPADSSEPRLRPAPFQDMVHLLRFSPALAVPGGDDLNSSDTNGADLPLSVPAAEKEKIELTPSKKKEI